jgi:hypothetical protein
VLREANVIALKRGEITLLRSRNRRNGEHDSNLGINGGAAMTIGEYLAATALVALILCAVLGLLMQEG